MPSRKPASPIRLVMNAFLPARALARSSNQKPIRRYDPRPTAVTNGLPTTLPPRRVARMPFSKKPSRGRRTIEVSISASQLVVGADVERALVAHEQEHDRDRERDLDRRDDEDEKDEHRA